MCGIAGWVDLHDLFASHRASLPRMTRVLSTRGPDGEGVWSSQLASLGHRRLAVIDQPCSKQPMRATSLSAENEVVLTYNGEVYNYKSVKAELIAKGHRFETAGDTEVVLRSYLEWGESLASHLEGIFAFAVWDEDKSSLLLGRDRIGVKPLFYHTYMGGLIFGSEPKALFASGRIRPRVREDSLPLLFNPRLALPGETPLEGVCEVRPGHVLVFNRDGLREQPYWQLESHDHGDSFKQTVHRTRDLLKVVVEEQMQADLPVASLLSGGLDSSAITAFAAKHADKGLLRTFSVDFKGSSSDFEATALRPERDSPYAWAASKFMGTKHTEVVVESEDFETVRHITLASRDLPTLGQFDESMLLLYRQVASEFKVVLSGEAGDELFGGYPWFFSDELVGGARFPWLGNSPSLTSLLRNDVKRRVRPDDQELDRYRTQLARVPRNSGDSAMERRMREVLFMSMQGPLNYLLDRNDRIGMAVGLEVRVPFCDSRLVEYAWNIPWAFKAAGGSAKSLLRSAATDLLPFEILNRKKSGYPASFSSSYRDRMFREVLDVVSDRSSYLHSVFDPALVLDVLSGVNEGLALASVAHFVTPIVEVDRWLKKFNVEVC